MAKPNKDGWIRHRGGVPKDVPLGQWVEIRVRGGYKGTLQQRRNLMRPDSIYWKHFPKNHMYHEVDIMAYKLIEAPKKLEELP